MRKILFFILFFVLIVIYIYDEYGKLGKGDYYLYDAGYQIIKNRKNSEIYIGNVISVKYNDNYIIALIIPQKYYNCNGIDRIKTIYKVKYIIIDKINNKIYGTYNKNKFKNKLSELNVNLNFQEKDYRKVSEKIFFLNKSKKNQDFKKCKKVFNFKINKL